MTATEPSKRTMWNYRCDQCFCETPVYADNNLCYYCDPRNHAEIERAEADIMRDRP